MQTVLVLDFGGQYNQLITRRVRDLNIHCVLLPYYADIEEIKKVQPSAIILSGGPHSVYEDNSPQISEEILQLHIPILGICYGLQALANALGGAVTSAPIKEYGSVQVDIKKSKLFDGLDDKQMVWMSHSDYISVLPKGFVSIASTIDCPVAAMENQQSKIYGVQFHPEVLHTVNGMKMIDNFLTGICKLERQWTSTNFVATAIEKVKSQVGSSKVLCAMSGGVDSAVAATLVYKAIGDQLTCIYVNHGLMRKNETQEVYDVFKRQLGMNLIVVDAEEHFLSRLKGVIDPEIKRKIIGEEFIRVFEAEAKKIGNVDYLVQGTIYPDVIESGNKLSGVIKSHHNVGGLPDVINFKGIIEPIRDLFKDEVRNVGRELGLPEFIVSRQPFPGPGLAVRVIGEITKAKLDILRDVDYIFRDEIAKAGLDKKIWQYFAVLTNNHTVGVIGDVRTYGYCVALRAVNSTDAMTASWAKIPLELLEVISTKITNSVKGVNRVVYDITSKPPSTIEWE